MTKELPYMPLYVNDFEVDTGHLSFVEDGVYNRLLRLCWRQSTCSVPDDREWLVRSLRTDGETFDRVVEPIIGEFFSRRGGRISQKRQREEWRKATSIRKARSDAGTKGVEAKRRKAKENDVSKRLSQAEADRKQSLSDPQAIRLGKVREGKEEDPSSSISESYTARDDDDDPFAIPPDPQDFHDQVLVAAGIDVTKDTSGKWYGLSQRAAVGAWTGLGLTEAEILLVVADVRSRMRNGPPSTLKYFDQAMEEAAGRKLADPLKPITPEKRDRDKPSSVFGDGPERE